jgi:hypothetical protein
MTPSSVLYVDANLVTKAQPRAARPAGVAASEQPMGRDLTQLPLVLLWLQALLIAALGAIWAWFRWGRRQAWLIGGIVVLTALWGLSGALSHLLPNLL